MSQSNTTSEGCYPQRPKVPVSKLENPTVKSDLKALREKQLDKNFPYQGN